MNKNNCNSMSLFIVQFNNYKDYLKIEGNVLKEYLVLENGITRCITCDIGNHSMTIRYKNGDGKQFSKPFSDNVELGIIDLNESGDRWEGGCVNGDPYGFGRLYSNENGLLYEGFLFDGKRVGYGKCFHKVGGVLEYEGSFYNDMKHGIGTLYDLKGMCICNGCWRTDMFVPKEIEISSSCGDINRLSNGMEVMRISFSCYSDKAFFSFILHYFPYLKSVEVEYYSFRYVKLFSISHCDQLESVNIASNCFQHLYGYGGKFRLRKCMKLKIFHSHMHCFERFTECEISGLFLAFLLVSDLPSLESIHFELSFGLNSKRYLPGKLVMESDC